MPRIAAVVALALGAHAFIPGTTPSTRLAHGRHDSRSRGFVARERRAANSDYEAYRASLGDSDYDDDDDDEEEGGVQFLTALATEEQTEAMEPGWVAAEKYKAGVRQDAVNFGPTSYEGFVDSEGFDGGDGQVGVVGDGDNQMEKFDTASVVKRELSNNAIGGADSKSAKTKVAFGKTTGYAESLAARGMTDVDKYGEDKLMARRQQLENWRNQQGVKEERDQVARYQTEQAGGTYDARTHTSGHYLDGNAAQATGFKAKYTGPSGFAEGVIVAEESTLQHGDVFVPDAANVLEEIRFQAKMGGRGSAEILVTNDAMTYEDFNVGFAAGTPAAFSVEPATGTLNRASGDPTALTINVDGSNLAGGQTYETFLVVDTEESKFTYKVAVSVL
jgi:hypothetical protein